MKYSMKILIKSFDPQTLKHSLEQIVKMRKLLSKVSCSNESIFGFPITTQKWTVLRSPHVDKKSREQFQIQNHSVLYNTNFNNKKELMIFFQKLKHTEIYGSEFSIEVIHSSYFNKFN